MLRNERQEILGKITTRHVSHRSEQGFGLVEMAVVIIVVGILAAVAMQSMVGVVRDARQVKTERELEILANAIVGNPEVMNGGVRSDFGYVGDVGAFPPNLQALYQNPGSYATWHGPYLPAGFTQDTVGLLTDEWGKAYSYSGGLTITSTGSGTPIVKKIADALSDYLYNTIHGTVKDANDSLPGSIRKDSVDIIITYPDGAGALTSQLLHPDSLGDFTLDSIPVGVHTVQAIYTPTSDTIIRSLTVLPRHKRDILFKFAAYYFSSDSSGAGNGLVGHWKFDETSGIIASDASGNGNHGTLIDMDTLTVWGPGKIDGCLDFDGTNDYVNVPDDNSLDLSDEGTLAAWIYIDSMTQFGGIIHKGNLRSFSDEAYTLQAWIGNRIILGIKSGWNLRLLLSNTHFTVGTWYHVAGAWDASGMYLYVNGVLDNSTTNTLVVQNSSGDLNIGAQLTEFYNGHHKNLPFNGKIDDVRVYNRALNAAEILALYNMGN